MENNIKIMALLSNWESANRFLIGHLNKLGLNNKQKNEICLACEEIYVNISNYAYPNEQGHMEISVFYDKSKNNLSIVFEDDGVRFNPLDVKPPELRGSALDRKTGGLGIFMAKNLTDNMEYTYKNGKNKLRLIKIIKEQ